VLAGCGGEIHKENQAIPPGHPHGGQDGGMSEQGDGWGPMGKGNPEHGAGGRGVAGVSAGFGGGEPSGTPRSNDGGRSGTGGATASDGGAPAASGSNAEADAAVTVVDPRHDERQRLVEQYCAACSTGSDCVPQMITEWFNWLPDTCWDEWTASMNCSMANGCTPLSGGMIGGGACLAERTAIDGCKVANRLEGMVTGSTGTCGWERPATGTSCRAFCPDDLLLFYDSDCDGPPGGPFRCFCRLNDVILADALVENGTMFYVNTCAEAAGMLANGYCQKYTSCCYTYTGVPLEGVPERTLCECTSSPGAGNFSSCSDLAVSKKDGKVVDLCARYQY
jgi:hypothetical protein